MLTQANISQGDLLQERLESDLRDLFGCNVMSENDSDHDTCSSYNSEGSDGDVSVITEYDEFDAISVEDEEVVTDLFEGMPEPQPEIVGCPGFALCIDNIDMNIRKSDQRYGRTTQSFHFCHGFAVQNRVNSTKLSDGPPSGVLSSDLILPKEADRDSILEDFTVLVSRYIHYIYIYVQSFCIVLYVFTIIDEISLLQDTCTVYARIWS